MAQRLHSFRLTLPVGNRYPYGAFNAYYNSGTFYASLRTDFSSGDVYYMVNKIGSEVTVNYTDMVWFASYFIYDSEKYLNHSNSFMELITDVTNYSKQLADLSSVPSGSHLKWNIYGVAPYEVGRKDYLTDDMVYGSNDGGKTYLIFKANTDAPSDLSSSDWDKMFNVTLNALEGATTMEDFVYYMLACNNGPVVPDFVEGDEIDLSEDPDESYDSNPFLKISCNDFRVNLSTLIFNPTLSPLSNVYMTISPVDEYSASDPGIEYHIFSSNLDANGYYDFEIENDGVYIVTIFYNGDVLHQNYLIVTCALEKCLDSLMESIYCDDLTCCENCDEDTLKEYERHRHELLKLQLFMNVISAVINHTAVEYTGEVILDSELHSRLEKVARWYEYVEEIIDRCGSCSQNDDTSNNCTQC